MKKLNQFLLIGALLVALFFVGCLKDNDMESQLGDLSQQGLQAQPTEGEEAHVITYSSNVIPGQYIVVYKANVLTAGRSLEGKKYAEVQQVMKEESAITLRRNNIPAVKVEFVYGKTIQGFSVKNLTEKELDQLRKDNQVSYIEQDQTMSVSMGGPPGGGGGGGGGQTTPWGITRVVNSVPQSGAGKRAWIIDSGIDQDHPDLNVNTALSVSFLSGGGGNTTPEDYNGHGTHVAGTVAAINNTIGVVGVAAGAEVVAVRVLDRKGSGSTSGVIAGVEYVGSNAASQDAANMSLGGGVSTSLDNAVVAASSACPFALAAGNESDHANNHSPARANGNNIYTVSSMTSSNSWSYFSNYGNPPVDFCAPGSSIPSTYKDGGYATLSGTSMAAPHVCGLLLLGNVGSDGTVSGDPAAPADPIAHQ